VGCDFLSFTLFFSFPERLNCCYIYIFAAATSTAAIIRLEPCALNVGTVPMEAQHSEIAPSCAQGHFLSI